jgi:putative phosphoribosyl transferase
VDDGLATGSTMLAAVAAVQSHAPAAVVVAVPVGARQAVQMLRSAADLVVCRSTPEPFLAVGGAYEDFRQLSDEEVLAILEQSSS